jgi:hypothetical protein
MGDNAMTPWAILPSKEKTASQKQAQYERLNSKGEGSVINPHTKTGEDLAFVAEHLATWPSDTDFVHVKSSVIHMIVGGDRLSVDYISREQWAAAKSLHQYWFPEKQPKPEGFCDVCGDRHSVHELYPGICEEYNGGMVLLDLAKAIHNGDYELNKQARDQGVSRRLWGLVSSKWAE